MVLTYFTHGFCPAIWHVPSHHLLYLLNLDLDYTNGLFVRIRYFVFMSFLPYFSITVPAFMIITQVPPTSLQKKYRTLFAKH